MFDFSPVFRWVTKPQYTWVKFVLGKLQDPLMDEQFKATIGGKFGPLLLLDNNSDIEKDIELFEQVITEAAALKPRNSTVV